MAEENRISLGPEEAVALWIQGRHVWNAWVEENPIADICFNGVDFGKLRLRVLGTIPEYDWPFANFEFPHGNKTFSGAKFGLRKPSFYCTKFRDGNVCFRNLESNTLNFSCATFGRGNINFDHARIGGDYTSFGETNFGPGNTSFFNTKFGSGGVTFHKADFDNGDICFEEAIFGDGDISFLKTTFGNGDVSFEDAILGPGDFYFPKARLGEGRYNFADLNFQGRANFSELENAGSVISMDFRHASFASAFILGSEEMFSCVPDLVGTKTSHHTSLAKLSCESPTATHKKIFKRTEDKGDAERLCRLKELAEQNRDFEKALGFKVAEMQAARWHGDYRWPTALVEGLFWLGSDYGRDLARPLLWLFAMFGLCANVYVAASISALSSTVVTKAILFSWGQMFVYIPSSNNARDEGLQILFDGHLPDWLYFITFSQSLLTLVLLFQVGLVLRNRFKL